MRRPATPATVNALCVPVGYPTSLIFMDESGSRASSSRFFVMGALKVRRSGHLARTVRSVRERNQFSGEFKFSAITRGTMCAYFDLIDQIATSDAHIAACVVNRERHNPFPGRPLWEAHAEVAAQLLHGIVNRRELVSVLMDGISTPPDFALDDRVRSLANRRLRATSVVTAACLDSRSNDLLQAADLVAGAIAHNRRKAAGEGSPRHPGADNPKAKVARRLLTAFELADFEDVRTARVNIHTLTGRRKQPDRVTSLKKSRNSA